ncbi:MAG: cation:proton antiporter [Candidatus Woesearchaeota archaeon]
MAVNYLADLSWLSILLLVGILCSIIALRVRLPQMLLLILAGVGIGYTGWVDFSTSFLTSFGVFALIMIVFDATSKFKLREISILSPRALRLSIVFLLMNLIFLTLATHLLFDGRLTVTSVLISLLFSALMSGTDAGAVLSSLKDGAGRIIRLIELESVLNTPITVIFPLIILFWFQGTLQASDVVVFFFRGIMAGVGTGLVLGLVSFKLMKRKYIETISPLVVIAVALISYTLAENIGGNGVLSVTTLGIVFGWSAIKEKESLKKFVTIFTNFLTIVIFILLGLFIALPSDKGFFIKSIILFGIYMAIRVISVFVSMWGANDLGIKERMFISLNISKGVAVASIAFILMTTLADPVLKLGPLELAALNNMIQLALLFILYTIVVSSISLRFTQFFLSRGNGK